MYYFESLEKAESFAMDQSKIRHTAYTIYENGKNKEAFYKGKKLPVFETVMTCICGDQYYFLERSEDNTKMRLTIKTSKYKLYINPGKTNIKANNFNVTNIKDVLYSYEESYGDEPIRISWTNKNQTKEFMDISADQDNEYVLTKLYEKHIVSQKHYFTKTSITFHNDGKVYFYSRKGVRRIYNFPGYIPIAEEMYKYMFAWFAQNNPTMARFTKMAYNQLPYNLRMRWLIAPNSVCTYDLFRNRMRLIDSYTYNFRVLEKLLPVLPWQIMEPKDVMNYIIQKLKLPNSKAFKKEYLFDPLSYFAVSALKQMGFKDINHIFALIKFVTVLGPKEYETWNYKMVKALIEKHGEGLVRKMLESGIYLLKDISTMYERADPVIQDFVITNGNNLQDIHDTLIYYSHRHPLINKPIYYDERISKLYNRTIDDFKFYLPEDDLTLARIGAEMGICVGSYNNRIREKETLVVAMKNLDTGKHIACIEIIGKDLIQLKSSFNNPVRLVYKEVIDKYIEITKTKINHCSDYEDIGRPWCSSYDYHTINPDLYQHENGNQLKMIHRPRATQAEQTTNEDDRAVDILDEMHACYLRYQQRQAFMLNRGLRHPETVLLPNTDEDCPF